MSDMQKELYEDWRIEILKSQLFDWGRDYIEEFIGEELDPDWDKDDIDDLMDEAIAQMPEEELEVFMEKFCVDELIKLKIDAACHKEEHNAILAAIREALAFHSDYFQNWWQHDFPTDIGFNSMEELLAFSQDNFEEVVNDWTCWASEVFVSKACESFGIDLCDIPDDKVEFVERVNEVVKDKLREKLYIWKDTREADIGLEKLMESARGERQEESKMTKQYCEEMHNYYGFPDHKYGGCLVGLGDLKEGTVFYVCNGAWRGKIEQVNGVKSVMLTTRHKYSIPSKSAQLAQDVLGPAKESCAFITINDSSDLEYIKTFFDEGVDIGKYSRLEDIQKGVSLTNLSTQKFLRDEAKAGTFKTKEAEEESGLEEER